MTPREWFLIYDAREGEPKYGSLTQTEVEDMTEALKEAQRNEHR